MEITVVLMLLKSHFFDLSLQGEIKAMSGAWTNTSVTP